MEDRKNLPSSEYLALGSMKDENTDIRSHIFRNLKEFPFFFFPPPHAPNDVWVSRDFWLTIIMSSLSSLSSFGLQIFVERERERERERRERDREL